MTDTNTPETEPVSSDLWAKAKAVLAYLVSWPKTTSFGAGAVVALVARAWLF